MSENIVLETLKSLGLLLSGITFVGLGLIQYLKETWKVVDKKAEILSLVVGFLMSAAVGWVYAESLAYHLALGQWVGVGMFLVTGTIAPSGSYKFLATLLGVRNGS